MLGDTVGRDEYTDQKHGWFRKIKAASGRASALNWNKVSAPISLGLRIRRIDL